MFVENLEKKKESKFWFLKFKWCKSWLSHGYNVPHRVKQVGMFLIVKSVCIVGDERRAKMEINEISRWKYFCFVSVSVILVCKFPRQYLNQAERKFHPPHLHTWMHSQRMISWIRWWSCLCLDLSVFSHISYHLCRIAFICVNVFSMIRWNSVSFQPLSDYIFRF